MSDQIKSFPIDKLVFDPLNPRIPLSRRDGGEPAILEYMIENENVMDLIGSIGQQGYFPGEPLLVVAVPDTDMFHVIEGNRRLAALRLLNNPSLATKKRQSIQSIVDEAIHTPDTVYVLEFDNRDAILDYLGFRHITGVDDWDSLQKARYLDQLVNRHTTDGISSTETFKKVAKLIGSRSDYVKKLVEGFRLYQKIEENDFFSIHNLNEENFSFSLLTTALSYSNIRSYVVDSTSGSGYDMSHVEELISWMFKENAEQQTRVPESRSLKTLNAVVSQPKALEAFKQGESLEEASLFTSEPYETYTHLMSQATKRIKLAHETMIHIEAFKTDDLEEIGLLVKRVESISDHIRRELTKNKE